MSSLHSTPVVTIVCTASAHRPVLMAVAQASLASHAVELLDDGPSTWAAAEAWIAAVTAVRLAALDAIPPELHDLL
jgi:hypothetical protein